MIIAPTTQEGKYFIFQEKNPHTFQTVETSVHVTDGSENARYCIMHVINHSPELLKLTTKMRKEIIEFHKNTRKMKKGNVKIENIKIGDIHYEFEMGLGVKSQVLSTPELDENGNYLWRSKNCTTGKEIGYMVNPKYPQHAVNLYDYEAYTVKKYI